MRTLTEIIIHCTATEQGRDITATEIDRWHRNRGWRGCGYHYIIRINGTIEVGRPIEEVGAHCRGRNQHSVGIAYVGGLIDGKPANTLTFKQWKSINTLCIMLLKSYPTIVAIHGHNYYNPSKQCPCIDVVKYFGHLHR